MTFAILAFTDFWVVEQDELPGWCLVPGSPGLNQAIRFTTLRAAQEFQRRQKIDDCSRIVGATLPEEHAAAVLTLADVRAWPRWEGEAVHNCRPAQDVTATDHAAPSLN